MTTVSLENRLYQRVKELEEDIEKLEKENRELRRENEYLKEEINEHRSAYSPEVLDTGQGEG